MLRAVLFFVLLVNVICDDDDDEFRKVELDIGTVEGQKYWNGDFYEFYGIKYAKAPTGRDRYKAPLPVEPWTEVYSANARNIVCEQIYLVEEEEDDMILDGTDDCLAMNLLVPEVASETNLVPVVVYIHSGAFAGGSSNMARFHYLARHDIIVISFNYRIGAIGFACLGTEDIPGNAGLKDQIAALKWINKYISKFGGDPNQVTLAGFSVGASMAELLALSKETDGLIHRLILESGSMLSPFAINRHPIETAKNFALSIGFNGTTMDELNEFLLTAPIRDIAEKSKNFFLTNSTFGLAPCIERTDNKDAFLTESPLDVIKRGDYKKIPILTGFSNMEGISRTIKFVEWRNEMNEDFSKFLPADLTFESDESRDDFIKSIKQRYFKNQPIGPSALQEYIDYFSDSMFKYSIMKSAKLHAAKNKVYLYEFSYLGKLNMKHHYMEKIKGASHRDQTAYILDFFDHTMRPKDLDTRDRMTTMWSDFVKYGNPTAFESMLVDQNWLIFTNKEQNYMEISTKLKMKKDLFTKRYQFWDAVYEKHYWNPTASLKPSDVNLNLKRKSETPPTPTVGTKQVTDKDTNAKPISSKGTENQSVQGEKIKTKPITKLKAETKPVPVKNTENKPVSTTQTKPKPPAAKEGESKSTQEGDDKPITTKENPAVSKEPEVKPASSKDSTTKPVEAKDSKLKPETSKETVTKSAPSKVSETKRTTSKGSETK